MTNTEIALLAHRAGFGEKIENSIRIEEFAKLKHFAEAVAEKEREACAELRNMFHPIDGHGRKEMIDAMNRGLDEYQAAIRARGQA
jgi:hypothetical protein